MKQYKVYWIKEDFFLIVNAMGPNDAKLLALDWLNENPHFHVSREPNDIGVDELHPVGGVIFSTADLHYV